MKLFDREALRWARYIAAGKNYGRDVVLFLALSVGLLTAGWALGAPVLFWPALIVLFCAVGQFERRGLMLLRDHLAPTPDEGKTARWGWGFIVLAILIGLSLKAH